VESLQSSSQIARIQAARELLSRRPVEPEPESQPYTHGINLEGVVVHAVAYGAMSAESIADVAILERAYTLVAGGSGHVREAAAIRARLDELPGDPPEIELPPVGGYRRGGGGVKT
jgi:hypothetical protein